MQRVIDRKLYDTETAEQIAKYSRTKPYADPTNRLETLYKTADGDYFLYIQTPEHAPEKYVKEYEGSIELLTEEEALDWCEDRSIDGEIVVAEFDHLIEQ